MAMGYRLNALSPNPFSPKPKGLGEFLNQMHFP
jgi:hypothetical protein